MIVQMTVSKRPADFRNSFRSDTSQQRLNSSYELWDRVQGVLQVMLLYSVYINYLEVRSFREWENKTHVITVCTTATPKAVQAAWPKFAWRLELFISASFQYALA